MNLEQYEIANAVQASLSDKKIYIGDKGECRFCGTISSRKFRTTAHTIPEALGNKWIISLDECDDCNAAFGRYDESLVKSIESVLTLGGTKGKRNKIRQSGRTGSNSQIRRINGADGKPQLSMMVGGHSFSDVIGIDSKTGILTLRAPLPVTPFIPRHAYKALVKIGLALLPFEELSKFRKLRNWLQDVNESEHFNFLEVGISFAYIGNAPPITAATVLRRKPNYNNVPYMMFTLSIGSVCFQIDLMPDTKDSHLPPLPMGTIKIHWRNVVKGNEEDEPLIIDYGLPTFLDWSGIIKKPQPLEAMELQFNPRTRVEKFKPVFRT